MDQLLSLMFIDPFFEEARIFLNKSSQTTIGVSDIGLYDSIYNQHICLTEGNIFIEAVKNLETYVNLFECDLFFLTCFKYVKIHTSYHFSNILM